MKLGDISRQLRAEDFPSIDPKFIAILNGFLTSVAQAMNGQLSILDNLYMEVVSVRANHGVAVNIKPTRLRQVKSAALVGCNGAIVLGAPVINPRQNNTVDVTVWFSDPSATNVPVSFMLLEEGQLADTVPTLALPAAILATPCITSAHLFDAAVLAAKIADNAVTTTKIVDLAVANAKIAATAVDTGKLADLAVTTAKIVDGAITAAKITAHTITANEIAALTITASEIAANTITAAKIAANTITAAQIAANTITAAQIAALTITASEIAAGAITAIKITAGEVVASRLSTGQANSVNLWPNGTSENAPPASITPPNDGTDAEFDYRLDMSGLGGAFAGKYARFLSQSGNGTTQLGQGWRIPVMPGEVYSVSSLTKMAAAETLPTAQLTVSFYRADDTVSTTASANLNNSTIGWGVGALSGQTAPSDVAYMKVIFSVTISDAGAASTYIDCISVRRMVDGVADITPASITNTSIAAGGVSTSNIATNAVTATQIATDAVTTVKILNANVTTAKIADANITAAKLDTGVTESIIHFGALSLTSATANNALAAGGAGSFASSGTGTTNQFMLMPAAGTLRDLRYYMKTGGSSTVNSISVIKNGSVVSGPTNVGSTAPTDPATASIAGVITTIAAGDVIQIKCDTTGSGGTQGPVYVSMRLAAS